MGYFTFLLHIGYMVCLSIGEDSYLMVWPFIQLFFEMLQFCDSAKNQSWTHYFDFANCLDLLRITSLSIYLIQSNRDIDAILLAFLRFISCFSLSNYCALFPSLRVFIEVFKASMASMREFMIILIVMLVSFTWFFYTLGIEQPEFLLDDYDLDNPDESRIPSFYE
jgi:hypothetical protein